MRIIRTILICGLIITPSAYAEGVSLGYITGNRYLELDNNDRLGWLVGVMDGIMAESTTFEKDEKGPWLGRCIKGLTTQQIQAIFEKELNQNPESWHAPAALIFVSKIQKFCKERT